MPSVFTENEVEYLRSQPLGRIATQQPNGTLQVSPVGFAYNAETQTIDVGGHNLESSRKFRNIAANGKVAFVVDDLASTNPWRPRFIEIRGRAEAVRANQAGPQASAAPIPGAYLRIFPERVLAWGLDSPPADSPRLNGMPFNARNVTAERDPS